MKTVNAAVTTALRTSYAVEAYPRLTVEWNLNRYLPVSADNIPAEVDEGQDLEVFPIESIYQNNRPTRGICKARVGEARVSSYDATPTDARYYLGGPNDVYKYWSSPVETDGSKVFPNHSDGQSKCRPHIKYTAALGANKIVISWENTWATPDSYVVYIQETVGGAWVQLSGSNFALDSKGRTVLYHQGSDSWTTTRPVDANGKIITNLKTLAGVMVKVNTLKAGLGAFAGDGSNSFCNVIEISARREEDMSSRLIAVNDTFDMGEKNIVYPMGTLTSNIASLELDNTDGVLSKDSESTYLRWLIEPGAIFNLEYVYIVNAVHYPVQQFKMYGGPWMGQKEDKVNVELTDFSLYLKEQKPPQLLYENLPVTQIIWRLCDTVGFVDYAIQQNDLTTMHQIPYFWTDGTKTAWELFDELTRATQTAVYFDAYGVMQVKTREAMFDEASTIDWVLMGQKNSELTLTGGVDVDDQYYVTGGDTWLPDIIDIDQTDEFEANHVTVNYQTTQVSDLNNGFPKMDKVWEPAGTTTLRSSQLVRSLTATATDYVWVNPAHAAYWPFSGIVQIEGEFIRYKAKNYQYYKAGVRTGANITSNDEKIKLDATTWSSQKQLNHFTGALQIDTSAVAESDIGFPGRGLWGSKRMAHSVDATGYSSRARYQGTVNSAASSFHHDKTNSVVTLDSGPRFLRWYDLCVVTRGSTSDDGYYYYGTKLRFEKAGKSVQRAGLTIHNGALEDGYYIELTPSNKITAGARAQGYHELWIYSRKSDATKTMAQIPVPIVEGQWYEIDVSFALIGGTTHQLAVFIDGVHKATVNHISGWFNTWQGRFGMHFRGQTRVSYEYLYAIARQDVTYPDDSSFYNRVDGAYQANQWDREWVFGWKTKYRKVRKVTIPVRVRNGQQIMDEFGPYVHEVREMNVKFDPAPVIHSNLYMTNDYQAVCTEYLSTPFGAKFLLSNASRTNAVVHGEDNLTYVGSTINQLLVVYGRVVTQADGASTVVQHEDQVRRRGKVEIEMSSPWIQSEAAAKDIGNWIIKHWAETSDEQTVQIFGNPVLEIGDVVTISYKHKAMMPGAPTSSPPGVGGYHKYYVVSTSTTWDNGLETTLILRRVRPTH